MALFKYLRPISTSDSSRRNSSVAEVASDVVLVEEKCKPRSAYIKLSLEKKAEIGKYASENGVANSIRHYKDLTLKKSSVRVGIGEIRTCDRFIYREKQPSQVKRLSWPSFQAKTGTTSTSWRET